MDDYEDDHHQRRGGRSANGSERGSSGRKKKSSGESGSSPRRKPKKKPANTAEDALPIIADDYEDDVHRQQRSGGGRSANGSERGSGGRKKKSSGESGSSPRRKSKKKPADAAEDALEAKMRAKKRREKKKNSSADDALEAKIRKKKRAAAAAESSSRRRADDIREEEKVEEGLSLSSTSSADHNDHDEERGARGGHRSRGAAPLSGGVPVASDPPPGDGDENALFTRGGADVRDRPSPGQRAPVLDPLREAEIEREKNKKRVNTRYADLHESGQWGGLTKWEKYAIYLLMLSAIVAAVALGVVFGRGDGDGPTPSPGPTASPTEGPSASPTVSPTDADYRENMGLEMMSAASPKLTLPQTPEGLRGAKTREESTPQELAAEFVLYDDPLDLFARDPRFMETYALAVLYYQNGGCGGGWAASSNWMNGGDYCDGWHGVVCDLKKRVIELNLSKNFVTGKIPMELGQLLELGALDLSNNALVGAVPARALSGRKMFTVRLNNNMLEGEFPFEEVKAGAYILDNLWIQENTGLSGTITDAYCGMNSITLDCDDFSPQPTYPDDSGLTKFESNCADKEGKSPKEYTCNFDDPDPFTKQPLPEGASTAPSPLPTTVCGTPAAGT